MRTIKITSNLLFEYQCKRQIYQIAESNRIETFFARITMLYSVDDVSALRRQLRASERSLRHSEKVNRQLMREMKRLEERIESTSKLQKMIAERQLRELGDGDSTASLMLATQQDRGQATNDTQSQPSTF